MFQWRANFRDRSRSMGWCQIFAMMWVQACRASKESNTADILPICVALPFEYSLGRPGSRPLEA
jgi:hypothetical protein